MIHDRLSSLTSRTVFDSPLSAGITPRPARARRSLLDTPLRDKRRLKFLDLSVTIRQGLPVDVQLLGQFPDFTSTILDVTADLLKIDNLHGHTSFELYVQWIGF